MTTQLKLFMESGERDYIQHNILNPISKDMDKMRLFGNLTRARMMLETSISRLAFDKNNYDVRLETVKQDEKTWWIVVSAGPRNCEERVSVNAKIELR